MNHLFNILFTGNVFIDILLSTLYLWIFFIFVSRFIWYADKVGGRSNVPKPIRMVAYPIIALFIAMDIAYNYTYGALLFLEPANSGRKLFTARLKHYIKYSRNTWRGSLAVWMCKHMIEPWDFNHCGLEDIIE